MAVQNSISCFYGLSMHKSESFLCVHQPMWMWRLKKRLIDSIKETPTQHKPAFVVGPSFLSPFSSPAMICCLELSTFFKMLILDAMGTTFSFSLQERIECLFWERMFHQISSFSIADLTLSAVLSVASSCRLRLAFVHQSSCASPIL